LQSGRKNGKGSGASLADGHRELDALFTAVRAALRGRKRERAAAGLARLRGLLVGHFESEENLYYPPLRALRPERAAALLDFTRDHARLGEGLGRVQRAVEQASLVEAKRALERVAEEFTRHEQRESALLEALQQELDSAVPGFS
jgi:hypothetical protein